MKEDDQGANGFAFSNEEIATSPESVLVNDDDLRKAIRNDLAVKYRSARGRQAF